ncbi:septal ring lytic transglycosylase RlpA family protein [Paraglaciecola sp.]|uniref:septal ring lytic transglycosylase RlpA family protein n=1 Tax=Paraglaciecola sp. TaxID=1920173 RepID=UPI0030F3D9FC
MLTLRHSLNKLKTIGQFAGVVAFALLVTACAQTPSGRYAQKHDSPPKTPPQEVKMHDAVPAHEPYANANLRPYTVRGINYRPLESGKGYSAEGIASWYGQKFHGHLTSNGEVYDMYTMSAAHTTLPLPSFARITNLANGNQVVVRINDRGPFHANRLIDLSYAAALKLGMLSTGTAKVKLDVIHIDETGQMTVGNGPTISDKIQATSIGPSNSIKNLYIQVAALQDKTKIDQLGNGLTTLYQVPYHSPLENGVYRLRLGPLADEQVASQLLGELKKNGYQGAYKIYLP